MPDLYIATKATFEKLKSLLQGFLLELDKKGNPVLLIKLEASLLDSIIKGVSIEVVLRNPYIKKRSCTLYIYDIIKNPFYVTGNNFGEADDIIKDFDKVALKLASSEKIKMVLYNEFTHPIYTSELTIDSVSYDLNEWLYQVYNNPKYFNIEISSEEGNFFPEDKFKGFSVKINNRDHSSEEKLIILAPEYEESFSHKSFDRNGKHGYYQESSIINNLSIFFKKGTDFFANPEYKDGNEFTDFILVYDKSIIIIESKYVISEKKTKVHKAITKAIKQLNKVEKEILNKEVDLTDNNLTSILNETVNVFKICLINDKIILTENNTKRIWEKYEKKQLPFFISVTSFFQLIGTLKIKNEKHLLLNLMLNYENLYNQYLSSEEKIMYHRNFKLAWDNK